MIARINRPPQQRSTPTHTNCEHSKLREGVRGVKGLERAKYKPSHQPLSSLRRIVTIELARSLPKKKNKAQARNDGVGRCRPREVAKGEPDLSLNLNPKS